MGQLSSKIAPGRTGQSSGGVKSGPQRAPPSHAAYLSSPSVSAKDVEEIKTSVDSVTEATKEVSGLRESASTTVSTYDSFKGMIQSLNDEKGNLVDRDQRY